MRLKVKGREKQQLVRKLPTQKSVSIVTALFKVDDELLAELREHQPAKRFKERELKVSPENAANLDNVRKKDQQAKDKNHVLTYNKWMYFQGMSTGVNAAA